jgi:hypothetical protein
VTVSAAGNPAGVSAQPTHARRRKPTEGLAAAPRQPFLGRAWRGKLNVLERERGLRKPLGNDGSATILDRQLVVIAGAAWLTPTLILTAEPSAG